MSHKKFILYNTLTKKFEDLIISIRGFSKLLYFWASINLPGGDVSCLKNFELDRFSRIYVYVYGIQTNRQKKLIYWRISVCGILLHIRGFKIKCVWPEESKFFLTLFRLTSGLPKIVVRGGVQDPPLYFLIVIQIYNIWGTFGKPLGSTLI